MTDIKITQNCTTIKFCYVFRNYLSTLSQSVQHITGNVPIFFTIWDQNVELNFVTIELNKRTVNKMRVFDFTESGICVCKGRAET